MAMARLTQREIQKATDLELAAMWHWLQDNHLRAIHTLRHEGYDDARIRQWLRDKAKITDRFILDSWSKLAKGCDQWCSQTFGRGSHVH